MHFSVHNICKSYNGVEILKDVSFNIEPGKIMGLIGPNGAGKSTLMNIIAGIVNPDHGVVNRAPDLSISFYLSKKGFFHDMSVKDNLRLFTTIMNIERRQLNEILEYFNVTYLDKRFGKLSSGLKQKTSLLIPFLKKSDLLVLDEPTNNLDIDTILLVKKKILELKNLNKSFLISSHQVNDLLSISDELLFMKEGQKVEMISRDKLLNSYQSIEHAYSELFDND